MKKFKKGKHGKSHVDHSGFKWVNDGKYESILVEPVPDFFMRPGDGFCTAKNFGGFDNNASIIFGRDRSGIGETDGTTNPETGLDDTNSSSGYSEYMGAGAIDIVVGRGAPFPVSLEGHSFGPLFKTKYDIGAVSYTHLRAHET